MKERGVPLRHLLFLSITWSTIPPSPSHKHITGINHGAARRSEIRRRLLFTYFAEETSDKVRSEEVSPFIHPGDEINAQF